MEAKQTRIDGFTVELEFYPEPANESGYTSSCCILGRMGGKEYGSSLECADAMGMLDETMPISARSLARIREWAEANGY
jgi:hypothetical protein